MRALDAHTHHCCVPTAHRLETCAQLVCLVRIEACPLYNQLSAHVPTWHFGCVPILLAEPHGASSRLPSMNLKTRLPGTPPVHLQDAGFQHDACCANQ